MKTKTKTMKNKPCIEFKLDGRTITVNAYTWKTDRHKRVNFDVWVGDEILISNTSDTDVAGYLVKEILAVLGRMVPSDATSPTNEEVGDEPVD